MRWLVSVILSFAVPLSEPVSTAAPTPDIKIDQVGYAADSPKFAFLVSARGAAPDIYSVRRKSDGKAVFEGHWGPEVFDPDSGDRVRTADFTSFNVPGAYYFEVPGIGRSWDFAIDSNIYSRPYYLTARGFYGQRCGSAVDLGPEFPGYRHGLCHIAGAFDSSSGRSGPHVSAKGWHDAGDYGRYMISSGISTATLLWAVELWGKGGMRKIKLGIPESGNGVPDLLSEARWNVDWMLNMQDSDGGVWHKQTSAHFCGFVSPDRDELPSLVIGAGQPPFKTSCATADLAAVAGIAARVFGPYDRAYADLCLAAARKAWQWVQSQPNVTFHNPPGITTGEYGDQDCSDEIFWAAAELARTTKEPAFESYFERHYAEFLSQITPDNPPDISHTGALGLWTYALGGGLNRAAIKTVVEHSLETANAIVLRTEAQAYRVSLVRKNYIWGSNGIAANYSMQLLIANKFRPDHRYVSAATENIHYLLGRNTFSLSFVTQLGSHAVEHIHHRPSIASNLAHPWPGLLSGGPNAGRQDDVSARLAASTPPARSFVDDQGSYSTNEIAINWNAPLVFVLAGLLPG